MPGRGINLRSHIGGRGKRKAQRLIRLVKYGLMGEGQHIARPPRKHVRRFRIDQTLR